jgi:hypothetical protein
MKIVIASMLAMLSLMFGGAAYAQSCPGLAVSVQAFTPTGEATLAVSGASNSVAFATNSASTPAATTAVITNLGTNTAFVVLGDSSASATSQAFPVLPGASVSLAIRANTYIAGISTAGNTTLRVSTGY